VKGRREVFPDLPRLLARLRGISTEQAIHLRFISAGAESAPPAVKEERGAASAPAWSAVAA
jgi:hypothetical protein